MPTEIARKLAVTVDHVVNLVDDDSFAGSIVKRVGPSRRSIRVPVESYRSFILKRSSRQAPPAYQTSVAFPSLDFPVDKAINAEAISKRLMLSIDQVRDVIEDGSLHAIDVKAAASKRHVFRVPIEAYRHFINVRTGRPGAGSFVTGKGCAAFAGPEYAPGKELEPPLQGRCIGHAY